MNQLAPRLFVRRYDDLLELGRSRLPGYAPNWTDYNAHDPGITLMELLAWIAEAQLYALARTPRRDEANAYAAMLDVAAAGTWPARGLIWPDRLDPASPQSIRSGSVVIEPDAVAEVENTDAPLFHPTYKTLWVAGRLLSLRTRLAGGIVLDRTELNARDGPAFAPFGEIAGPRDLLSMEFETTSDDGLFPPRRSDADGAHLVIGIRAADAASDVQAEPSRQQARSRSPLAATMVVNAERFDLPIVDDTTEGLLRTGALVLDLAQVSGSPRRFSIELRAVRGLERPPRLLRIEPNVMPITQGHCVAAESHDATGQPDMSFSLDEPGLSFAAGEEPVQVRVEGGSSSGAWMRCERLSSQGPLDRVYEFDAATARLTFGNGVNGQVLAQATPVLVSYAVCEGKAGNMARNRHWRLSGFAGTFGVNPDPVSGGADRADKFEIRRTARRRAVDEHALVSSDDISSAARALPLLQVARAWVLAPTTESPQTGEVTLVAMRSRPQGTEPTGVLETPRWLDAVRSRLAERMLLGTRLVVVGPRYVEFVVRAELKAQPGRDPDTVKVAVTRALRQRLALVKLDDAREPREPGVAVSRRDVAAWMRGADGVREVTQLQFVLADGRVVEDIQVPRNALPKIDLAGGLIDVSRASSGDRP